MKFEGSFTLNTMSNKVRDLIDLTGTLSLYGKTVGCRHYKIK